MHFVPELIVKRGAPLAIVWRAAHGQLKGVSKRDRERVRLVVTIQEIFDPPVPLQLGLSAALSHGTVIIYREQRALHLQRVQRTHKAVCDAAHGGGRVEGIQPSLTARFADITYSGAAAE